MEIVVVDSVKGVEGYRDVTTQEGTIVTFSGGGVAKEEEKQNKRGRRIKVKEEFDLLPAINKSGV